MTILEFKPKETKKVVQPCEQSLEFWKERNDIILANFPTMSYHEKQNTIEAVVDMNNSLYKMLMELKAELKFVKGE